MISNDITLCASTRRGGMEQGIADMHQQHACLKPQNPKVLVRMNKALAAMESVQPSHCYTAASPGKRAAL